MQTVDEVESDLNEEPNCNDGEVAQMKQVKLKTDEVGKIPSEKPEFDEEQKGNKEEVEQTKQVDKLEEMKWFDQRDEGDNQQSKHVMEKVEEVECKGDLKPEIEEMQNEVRDVKDNESTTSIKQRSSAFKLVKNQKPKTKVDKYKSTGSPIRITKHSKHSEKGNM